MLMAVAALSVGACTFEREGSPDLHFADFKAEPPRKNSVFLCHAYGCQMQTKVTFGTNHIQEIASIMAKTKKADTPHEERRAVAYAVAYMYKHTGEVTGTKGDRPGMDFQGPGDPTQMDCVDHSANTTSFLIVLQNNNLMKHHTVGRPFGRGNILLGVSNWPHWTAVLFEKSNGQKWAVDSWIHAHGENPAVTEAEKWYTRSLDELPKATR